MTVVSLGLSGDLNQCVIAYLMCRLIYRRLKRARLTSFFIFSAAGNLGHDDA